MSDPATTLPAHHNRREDLLRLAAGPPVPAAIVHPCDAFSVISALEAKRAGLIEPLLIGPEAKIRAAAESAGVDLKDLAIEPVPHSHAAASRAVELARSGRVALLIKGALHTDELMSAVLADQGLRTERRVSHVYVMDTPTYPRPLFVTDAAINIEPDLEAKRDIVQNAIDLAHVLGIGTPRVAVLAAVETVTSRMPATLHAAALCKMADRGQIYGAQVDGPLAFDNAVSPAAAEDKGIRSEVAGRADILVVPNIEAGNMLAKQLTFLGGADAAAIVLGARQPIVLTSRADPPRTRIASCALGVILARQPNPACPGGSPPA